MELNWYCTDMLEMRHQCWCGLLWIFKRVLVSPLGRQKSPCQSVWFLIVNIQANRVAFVSSVITKKFNPSKYWSVTIQLLVNDTLLISACIVYCQFFIIRLLFDSVFCSIQCFCSTQCFVRFGSFVQYFSVFELFSVFSVLILEIFSRYFDPVIHQPTSSQ